MPSRTSPHCHGRQMNSLLADLLAALDPTELAGDVGISPDPWQADLLTSTSRKILVLCSRQSGKSTTAALLGLHTALYERGDVLLVSPSQRQSSELFRKLRDHYAAMPHRPELVTESATTLEFRAGGRIISLPGAESTVRGFSGAKAIIVDEASRVPDSMMASLRPILATSGGRLIALSTPAGKRGWFYRGWIEGHDWHRITITAEQCPRISPEFLADELAELGSLLYRQEYLCEFVDDSEALFPSHLIDACFRDDCPSLWPR